MSFCLDANISYLVADVIEPSADVVHVSRVGALSTTSRGRSNAPDEDVARWCTANERVLVTCDDDFRGRRTRTAGFTETGLEVIVFRCTVARASEPDRHDLPKGDLMAGAARRTAIRSVHLDPIFEGRSTPSTVKCRSGVKCRLGRKAATPCSRRSSGHADCPPPRTLPRPVPMPWPEASRPDR